MATVCHRGVRLTKLTAFLRHVGASLDGRPPPSMRLKYSHIAEFCYGASPQRSSKKAVGSGGRPDFSNRSMRKTAQKARPGRYRHSFTPSHEILGDADKRVDPRGFAAGDKANLQARASLWWIQCMANRGATSIYRVQGTLTANERAIPFDRA